jgi:hypothetical protein
LTIGLAIRRVAYEGARDRLAFTGRHDVHLATVRQRLDEQFQLGLCFTRKRNKVGHKSSVSTADDPLHHDTQHVQKAKPEDAPPLPRRCTYTAIREAISGTNRAPTRRHIPRKNRRASRPDSPPSVAAKSMYAYRTDVPIKSAQRPRSNPREHRPTQQAGFQPCVHAAYLDSSATRFPATRLTAFDPESWNQC